MCGRFAQPRSPEDLARIFSARPATDLAGNRFNVAPTDPVAAIVSYHGERVIEEFRWGLVPVYAESPRSAARLINARSETVARSPAFRASFRRMRCIVPADAFYEWRRHRDATTGRVIRSEPFAIRLASGEPMAFAALWAIWRDPRTGDRLHTTTILTGPPNALVERVHDRMPIILDPADWDAWLADDTPPAALGDLLHPTPATAMRMFPVTPAVNSVRSEGAQLMAPLSRWQSELWPA